MHKRPYHYAKAKAAETPVTIYPTLLAFPANLCFVLISLKNLKAMVFL